MVNYSFVEAPAHIKVTSLEQQEMEVRDLVVALLKMGHQVAITPNKEGFDLTFGAAATSVGMPFLMWVKGTEVETETETEPAED